MNFIEQIFGIAPDGGSGAMELMVISAFVLIAFVVKWQRTAAKRAPMPQSSQG